jgi:hypothetical protein
MNIAVTRNQPPSYSPIRELKPNSGTVEPSKDMTSASTGASEFTAGSRKRADSDMRSRLYAIPLPQGAGKKTRPEEKSGQPVAARASQTTGEAQKAQGTEEKPTLQSETVAQKAQLEQKEQTEQKQQAGQKQEETLKQEAGEPAGETGLPPHAKESTHVASERPKPELNGDAPQTSSAVGGESHTGHGEEPVQSAARRAIRSENLERFTSRLATTATVVAVGSTAVGAATISTGFLAPAGVVTAVPVAAIAGGVAAVSTIANEGIKKYREDKAATTA